MPFLTDIYPELKALKTENETGAKLITIGHALDEMSWEWLINNHPQLAEAVELSIDSGATPGQIRRYVMAQTQRLELALRCQQAAQYLSHAG